MDYYTEVEKKYEEIEYLLSIAEKQKGKAKEITMKNIIEKWGSKNLELLELILQDIR